MGSLMITGIHRFLQPFVIFTGVREFSSIFGDFPRQCVIDFHGSLQGIIGLRRLPVFIDVHRFSWIFIDSLQQRFLDFHKFEKIAEYGYLLQHKRMRNFRSEVCSNLRFCCIARLLFRAIFSQKTKHQYFY